MDIMAPSPISAVATVAAHSAVSGAPDVTRVETRPGAEQAHTDAHTANGQGSADNAADYRVLKNRTDANGDPSTIDPYSQTGPTPSFQITLLEVEQDLQTILARIEANRAKDTNADAIRATDPEAAEGTRNEAKQSVETAPEAPSSDNTSHDADADKLSAPQPVTTTSLPPSQTEVQPNTPQIALSEAAKPDVIPA